MGFGPKSRWDLKATRGANGGRVGTAVVPPGRIQNGGAIFQTLACLAYSRVGMFYAGGMAPGVEEVGDDLGDGDAMFDLGKDKGAVAAHP